MRCLRFSLFIPLFLLFSQRAFAEPSFLQGGLGVGSRSLVEESLSLQWGFNRARNGDSSLTCVTGLLPSKGTIITAAVSASATRDPSSVSPSAEVASWPWTRGTHGVRGCRNFMIRFGLSRSSAGATICSGPIRRGSRNAKSSPGKSKKNFPRLRFCTWDRELPVSSALRFQPDFTSGIPIQADLRWPWSPRWDFLARATVFLYGSGFAEPVAGVQALNSRSLRLIRQGVNGPVAGYFGPVSWYSQLGARHWIDSLVRLHGIITVGGVGVVPQFVYGFWFAADRVFGKDKSWALTPSFEFDRQGADTTAISRSC